MDLTTQQKTARIAWIDLAKGFCIILVVLYHVTNKHPFAVQLTSFRMPLYFILSGLFFKQYEGFLGFLKRKTNKLLIPFLFFLLFTSYLPHLLITHKSSLPVLLMYREVIFNLPIWFLLCLFEINIIFYLVQLLGAAISSRYQTAVVIVLSVLIGFGGILLGLNGIEIPLFVDTACSALPLFVFGWWLNRKTSFLRMPVRLQVDVPIIIVCALIVCFMATPQRWIYNTFTVSSMKSAYLCGIAGTMMVLMVSKIIKRLPLVSYWGRYSIIILCTHYPVKMLFMYLTGDALSYVPQRIVVFLLTLTACHFLIPVVRRFLPYVTAQKDVIKV